MGSNSVTVYIQSCLSLIDYFNRFMCVLATEVFATQYTYVSRQPKLTCSTSIKSL